MEDGGIVDISACLLLNDTTNVSANGCFSEDGQLSVVDSSTIAIFYRNMTAVFLVFNITQSSEDVNPSPSHTTINTISSSYGLRLYYIQSYEILYFQYLGLLPNSTLHINGTEEDNSTNTTSDNGKNSIFTILGCVAVFICYIISLVVGLIACYRLLKVRMQ